VFHGLFKLGPSPAGPFRQLRLASPSSSSFKVSPQKASDQADSRRCLPTVGAAEHRLTQQGLTGIQRRRLIGIGQRRKQQQLRAFAARSPAGTGAENPANSDKAGGSLELADRRTKDLLGLDLSQQALGAQVEGFAPAPRQAKGQRITSGASAAAGVAGWRGALEFQHCRRPHPSAASIRRPGVPGLA